MKHIHLAKECNATDLVSTGPALCGAGYAHRTENEQTTSNIFDDVTCRNCQRIVRASNRQEDAQEAAQEQATHARTLLTRISEGIAAVIEATARAGARVPREVRDAVNELALTMADVQQLREEK